LAEPALLNLLVAYPYARTTEIEFIKENIDRIRIVIDSGAFTAWKAGKPIALDDYCKFLEALPFKPWRYFTLDMVGDPHGSLKNYQTMLSRGFKPVPIFTRGEDPQVLDEYYKTSDVVGIGGLVGTQGNKGFVKGIMKLVNGRRVHLLGFTNLAFLKVFKPYMADSSSWEMGARFASCPLYLGGGAPLVSIRKDTVHKQLKDEKIRAAIRALKLEPDDFLKPEMWKGGYSITRRTGARSMVRLSTEVGEKLGTKLFLAATTQYACKLLLEGIA
jgi:hypothetical protein